MRDGSGGGALGVGAIPLGAGDGSLRRRPCPIGCWKGCGTQIRQAKRSGRPERRPRRPADSKNQCSSHRRRGKARVGRAGSFCGRWSSRWRQPEDGWRRRSLARGEGPGTRTMARTVWCSNHPPNCTCYRCNELRMKRRPSPPPQRRGLGQPTSRSKGGFGKVLVWLLVITLAAGGGWLAADDDLRGRLWERVDAIGINTQGRVEQFMESMSESTESDSAFLNASSTSDTQLGQSYNVSSAANTGTISKAEQSSELTIVPPHLRHLEQKKYMLELINHERERAGVGSVVLGTNNAVQLKAESAITDCAGSHWGLDGLKPYMRYSLAGGYQTNAENGSGLHYCYGDGDSVRAIEAIANEVREAMQGWMNSPAHRRNLLKATHQKVNIGLAWDRYNTAAYQHFEGDYLDFSLLPAISNEDLVLSGTLKNGAVVRTEEDLGVQIYYDPPPHSLTRGQLSRTYCYDGGILVASLRPPLTGGWFYDTHQFSQEFEPCPDPYDVSADTPPPRSPNEANQHHREAKAMSEVLPPETRTVPWITAGAWVASDKSFEVRADINNILGQFGPGVYTIVVWARLMGDDEVVSEYSIFHGVTPPTGYGG